MELRTLVSGIVGAAAVTWGGVLWLAGEQIGLGLAKPFGAVVAIVTTFAVFFETVLWRLPLIRSWIAKRPPISGTWRATLISSYKDENGEPIKKVVYLVIAQTLSTLSVRMFTDKAHSFSLTERIRSAPSDDLFELAIVYQNVPDIDQRMPDGSGGTIHFGALLIPNVPYKPETLSGHYWTDRRTEGKLILDERRRPRVSSFAQGQKLFQRSPTFFERLLF
ncbi:hypothetical protein [Bosea sp. (in: a-proteobacteria)]|uniref:Cap15 family cyclic dinucleotide receptor domain-containing protein n=1 Tax=Bosea sp. (in: a-proteobacteria) TaxID=1871050 RepID=UPI0025BDC020|nr:hypothetical protein [Bosea sp. (in: a-proteobacteria)]